MAIELTDLRAQEHEQAHSSLTAHLPKAQEVLLPYYLLVSETHNTVKLLSLGKYIWG